MDVITFAPNMRRVIPRLAAMCVAMYCHHALFAAPRAKDKNENVQARAEAVLARARAVVDLSTAGSLPFRLNAKIQRFDDKGGSAEGTYLLFWSAPDKFRWEIDSPDYSSLNVRVGDQLWTKRSTPYIPLVEWTTQGALHPAKQLAVTVSKKFTQIKDANDNGLPLTCIENGVKGMVTFEVCQDAATGNPVFIENRVYETRLEYREYAPVAFEEDRHFPGLIRCYRHGKLFLEIKVAEIQPLSSIDPAWLTPPQDAKAWTVCDPSPVPIQELDKSGLNSIFVAPHVNKEPVGFTYYARINQQGELVDLRILDRQGPAKAEAALEFFFSKARFQPLTCNGKPIEAEWVSWSGTMWLGP